MTDLYSIAAIVILTAVTTYLFGYSAGSKNDMPVKRTIEQMNADEVNRSNERKVINLRASLITIRNRVSGQQSGTARWVYKQCSDALA